MTTHHCVSLAWSESGGFVELWNTIPNNDSSTTTQSTVCALTGPSHRSLPPALTRPHSSTFSLHNCRGHHHTALPQAAAPPSPLTDSSPTLPTHRQQPHPPHLQTAAPPSPLTVPRSLKMGVRLPKLRRNKKECRAYGEREEKHMYTHTHVCVCVVQCLALTNLYGPMMPFSSIKQC